MKIKLLLLIMLITFGASAQTPDYFSNNPKWRVNTWFGGNGDCLEVYDYVAYTDGDTLVNGHVYTKVLKRGICNYHWKVGPGPPQEDCQGSYTFHRFEGLVRQEGKKMYLWEGQMSNEDALLYDFDLEVGDTLQETYVYRHYDDFVVTSIDSILVGDSYRKVFNLKAPYMVYPEEVLIEGIGFGGGLLDICPFQAEFPSFLECFTLNDTTFYPEYGAPCELNVSVPQIPDAAEFKTYPNPVTDQFNIELPPNTVIDNVSMVNLLGTKVQANHFESKTGELTLDLNGLTKGMYIVELARGNQIIKRLKILKQ
jgi:hypothetical protein